VTAAPPPAEDTVPGVAPDLVIDDVDVFIDGRGDHTLLMVHGWPDTPALWDATVAELAPHFRCVRFHLPGFDLVKGARPASLDELSTLMRRIVDAVSPDQPVTLVLHDWGCAFGYEFAARHRDRVARVVGVDIGDHNSRDYLGGLNLREKLMIAGYQLWLAVAWKLGPHLPGLANRMTRWMARTIGCRNDPQLIGWEMNYPYAMGWFKSHGGLHGMAPVRKLMGESLPGLFIYGRRKPFMFHSAAWLRHLGRQPGCAARGLEAGHWLMKQKPAEFNALVKGWLLGEAVDQPRPKA